MEPPGVYIGGRVLYHPGVPQSAVYGGAGRGPTQGKGLSLHQPCHQQGKIRVNEKIL